MKTNFLFFIIITIFSIGTIKTNQQKQLCKTKENCESVNASCQCYCAVCKFPRNKYILKEYPIFYEPDKDPYGKSCYCGAKDLKILEAMSQGMSHHRAVEKYKLYFPSPEETKQIKELFAKK